MFKVSFSVVHMCSPSYIIGVPLWPTVFHKESLMSPNDILHDIPHDISKTLHEAYLLLPKISSVSLMNTNETSSVSHLITAAYYFIVY